MKNIAHLETNFDHKTGDIYVFARHASSLQDTQEKIYDFAGVSFFVCFWVPFKGPGVAALSLCKQAACSRSRPCLSRDVSLFATADPATSLAVCFIFF